MAFACACIHDLKKPLPDACIHRLKYFPAFAGDFYTIASGIVISVTLLCDNFLPYIKKGIVKKALLQQPKLGPFGFHILVGLHNLCTETFAFGLALSTCHQSGVVLGLLVILYLGPIVAVLAIFEISLF